MSDGLVVKVINEYCNALTKLSLRRAHPVTQLSRQTLETVLLKAAVLQCQKTTDEVRAIDELCQVSHRWWHVIQNCHRRKRAAFRQCIDSFQNCRRATLKVRFHMTGQIRGVAYLDDVVSKICVICKSWNTISVFHALPPYEQLRGIHVSGLRQPTDMVACTTYRLLYVSDEVEGCVWQVTTGGKVDWRLPAWSPTKRKAVCVSAVSLSVQRGRLVVVERQKISIYDPHDNKADEIKFSEFVTLRHAVENDRRSVLVALSDASADLGSSVIQEMQQDSGGKWSPVREWNLKNSDIPELLYMVWDSLGFLLVAVQDSHRVRVLDNALTEVRSVRLNRRSLPSRICFLSRRQKLFLVVGSGADVRVYDDVMPPLQYSRIRRNVTL